MQQIGNYTNVFFDPNSTSTFDQLNEKEYVLNVLERLHINLADAFTDFCFIFFSANGNGHTPASKHLAFSGKKKVLFYLSDETGKTGEELKDHFYCIFKSYLPFNTNQAIYPFPLGHVNNIHFIETEIKDISSRKINIFFSGTLNKNRIDFFKQFSSVNISSVLLKYLIKIPFIRKRLTKKVKKEYTVNSFINFTSGFKQGLQPQAYKACLLNSKIVFCPKGFTSAETFRHFEAMSAGCIIISEKLPDTSLYEGSPILQIQNWNEGITRANLLLADPARLEELQQNTLRFWQNKYSYPAIANYIQQHL
jgi:hypothetical protein